MVTVTTHAPARSAAPTDSAPRPEGDSARRHLSGTLILTATMLGVSAANYLLNLVLARYLSPAEFGDANLAVNLVLAAAAAAATLQLLSARSGAVDDPAAIRARRTLMRWAWAVGILAGAGLVLGSPALAQTFTTSTPLIFVVIGVGLPVYLAQAVLRGALQGELRLGRLAGSYAAEAATRVALALLMLALGFGVIGASVAISLSFVASAIVARHRAAGAAHARPAEPVATATKPGGGLAAMSMSATALLIGQVVIANGDVIAAKAVMGPAEAGTYAAAAVIGRGLYFLSWSVVHSTFPVVARAETGHLRRRASMRALAMIVTVCVVGIAGLWMLGEQLTPLLLGDDYTEAAEILVPYAVATALFAVANLVATLDLAVGRWHAPAALLVGAALQTLLLVTFGATPMSMAIAQVIAMGATVLLVAAAHLCDNRTESRKSQAAGVNS
ncbi:MAG: hypothetical protein E6Q56_05315 [Mycobacterium sp.]|nr:MAG: hypothetical protein E6Q56_05315 [Mycobacterium sp.]